MQGVAFHTSEPFASCFAGAMDLFRQLSWLIDVQSGPFLVTPDHEGYERRLRELHEEFPLGAATSTSLWRPGVFPELAPFLQEDEFSYLVGIPAQIDEAKVVMERLVRTPFLSERFFASVAEARACFLLEETHGEWEVYCLPECDLLRLVAEKPGARRVTSDKWAPG